MRSVFFIILVVLFNSCSEYPIEVSRALELSGKNEEAYRNLLDYYKRTDNRKYKAACFLLSNMPYHKSNSKVLLDSAYFNYFRLIDSIYYSNFASLSPDDQLKYKPKNLDSIRISLAEKYKQLPKPIIQKGESDIKSVSPDFIRSNIENAFESWGNSPFLKNMSFEEFKEFVLPYRTTDECLQCNRSQLKNILEHRIPIINDENNIKLSIEYFKAYIDKCRWLNYYIDKSSHLGMFDILLSKFKMDCHNLATWTTNYFRALGIPTVYEFTPQLPENDRRHFWCVSPDSNHLYQPYSPPENNLGEDWEESLKYVGKVYRKTFQLQKNSPYFLINENEMVPDCFNVPNLQDVSFRYHKTVTLRLPINFSSENNFAYLCFFTRNGFNPVAWGKIDKTKNEIVFEQVPLNTLFFPAYYDSEELIQFSEPFILKTNGEIDYIPEPRSSNENKNIVDLSVKDNYIFYTNKKKIEPENIKYQKVISNDSIKIHMRICRKYPQKRNMYLLQQKLKGAFFLGSNQLDGPFDTLFHLPDTPKPFLQNYTINNSKKYRYYFFKAPEDGAVNTAHIEFLGNFSSCHKCSKPTPLPIFSHLDEANMQSNSKYKIEGRFLSTSKHIENAFDNNYETYVGSSKIIVDFSVPVNISDVRFVPRNANNIVVNGDKYELLYFKEGKWIHFNTQKAKYNYLDFSNVPSGTLYWLKNLNRGKEELPFFYIKEKQIFINQLSDFL